MRAFVVVVAAFAFSPPPMRRRERSSIDLDQLFLPRPLSPFPSTGPDALLAPSSVADRAASTPALGEMDREDVADGRRAPMGRPRVGDTTGSVAECEVDADEGTVWSRGGTGGTGSKWEARRCGGGGVGDESVAGRRNQPLVGGEKFADAIEVEDVDGCWVKAGRGRDGDDGGKGPSELPRPTWTDWDVGNGAGEGWEMVRPPGRAVDDDPSSAPPDATLSLVEDDAPPPPNQPFLGNHPPAALFSDPTDVAALDGDPTP